MSEEISEVTRQVVEAGFKFADGMQAPLTAADAGRMFLGSAVLILAREYGPEGTATILQSVADRLVTGSGPRAN